ncbi:MAG: Appr-1-p processing protein [Acidobacteria bacterium]|nr:Appr-1-p processing protein [Acidobacteriota bacterium]
MSSTSNFGIQLVAFSDELYNAWQKSFNGIADVTISHGDILTFRADAIVSPANSFGYMDGGLDLKYSQCFGWELEKKLRTHLETYHFGELPVGQAVIIPTGPIDQHEIRYLISAPTMRVPMRVAESPNAYLAFKAVIHAVLQHNQSSSDKITSVLCPGLGTGEGKMPAQRCARQMLKAYETCLGGKMETRGGLAQAVRNHMELLK